MLQPIVLADHEAVSRRGADWLSDLLRNKPDALCCLASGGTPTRMYELLAERGAAEPELFARVRILKLDEWGGLPAGDPATCEHHLRRTLIDPLGLGDRYAAFASDLADPTAECARIANWLDQNGPIDACVLGLGVNGHLGFNEPADALQPHTHIAELSGASLSHVMVRESAAQPTYGLTLGMADLMQSRQVVLLVSGQSKQQPLQQLLTGRITTAFPASLLHMHGNATLFCDAAARG